MTPTNRIEEEIKIIESVEHEAGIRTLFESRDVDSHQCGSDDGIDDASAIFGGEESSHFGKPVSPSFLAENHRSSSSTTQVFPFDDTVRQEERAASDKESDSHIKAFFSAAVLEKRNESKLFGFGVGR